MNLGGGTGELVLNGLKISDRLAELLPFARVLDGVIQRALRETDHLRTDCDAAFVQRFNRGAIALADFAEDVPAGHGTVLEEQFARAAGADAQLVFFLANRETGKIALDEKRGDAAVPGFGIDGGEDDEQIRLAAVRDPELAAGQRPAVAALHGACRQRERIAARSALRQ